MNDLNWWTKEGDNKLESSTLSKGNVERMVFKAHCTKQSKSRLGEKFVLNKAY